MAPTALPDIILAPPTPAIPIKPQRLVSLDVFRGLTIAAMIVVNNMADPKYVPLEHAEWNGWTLTDLIFPFFLFIVGVAMPFSFARRSVSSEQTRGQMLARVWLRALSLWMLGQLLFAWPMPRAEAIGAGFAGYKLLRVFCFVFVWGGVFALLTPWRSRRLQTIIPLGIAVVFYGLMIGMHYATQHAHAAGLNELGSGIFNPDMLRIPGVLQRIGLVYGVAGTIALFAGWRGIATSAVVLCALYSILMLKVPYGPDHHVGRLEFEDNLARHVDEKVFDRYTVNEQGKRVYTQRHAYRQYPDNEGLLSTIPAIATSLLGILVGLWLRTGRTPPSAASACSPSACRC
jgi:predicted acyltransferase